MIKALIATIIIMIGLPYQAIAQDGAMTEVQTGCAGLNSLLKTVSMAQDLQSDETWDTLLASQTVELSKASIEALLPVLKQKSLAREAAEISQYILQLKQAITVSGAISKERPKAKPAWSMTTEFRNTLISLDNFWRCSEERELDDLYAIYQAETAQFYGEENSGNQNKTSRKPNPSAVENERQMGETSGSTVNLVSMNAVRLSPKATVAIVIFGFVALLCGVLLYFKRLETYVTREARSLIHSPVIVKLDGIAHRMQLVDISMNGAKIKHEHTIGNHDKLLMKLGADWHAGNIRWHNNFFAGVSFKSPLEETLLKNILRARN